MNQLYRIPKIAITYDELLRAVRAKQTPNGRYDARVQFVEPEDEILILCRILRPDQREDRVLAFYGGGRSPEVVKELGYTRISLRSGKLEMLVARYVIADRTIVFCNEPGEISPRHYKYIVCDPNFRPLGPRLTVDALFEPTRELVLACR